MSGSLPYSRRSKVFQFRFMHQRSVSPSSRGNMSQSELETLARWRAIGARHSDEVMDLAGRVLKSGQLGDQGG